MKFLKFKASKFQSNYEISPFYDLFEFKPVAKTNLKKK